MSHERDENGRCWACEEFNRAAAEREYRQMTFDQGRWYWSPESPYDESNWVQRSARRMAQVNRELSAITPEQAQALATEIRGAMPVRGWIDDTHRVETDLPAPPESYTDAAAERAWAQEINQRAANDEVLASERREAMFRANRADSVLDRWITANEDGVAVYKRMTAGEKIPEQPVDWSWL